MTPTGRKVVAIYGDALLDDVEGIEVEAAVAERTRIAESVRGLEEWLAYAKQSKVPEMDTEWADGYRQGWVAAYTLMETKIALAPSEL